MYDVVVCLTSHLTYSCAMSNFIPKLFIVYIWTLTRQFVFISPLSVIIYLKQKIKGRWRGVFLIRVIASNCCVENHLCDFSFPVVLYSEGWNPPCVLFYSLVAEGIKKCIWSLRCNKINSHLKGVLFGVFSLSSTFLTRSCRELIHKEKHLGGRDCYIRSNGRGYPMGVLTQTAKSQVFPKWPRGQWRRQGEGETPYHPGLYCYLGSPGQR
jgi:hypothetical protein